MGQVPIGGQPSISGQYGTYASPDVQQNPGSFPADSSKVNMVPAVDQEVKSKIDPDTYKKDVDAIKDKVTPDDVITGLEYELKKQIYKNKMAAKETVVKKLKENPRYYRDLGMLGMTVDMMNETKNAVNQSEEIKNLLHRMAKEPSIRRERVEPKYGKYDEIKKLMDEKWQEKLKKHSNGF